VEAPEGRQAAAARGARCTHKEGAAAGLLPSRVAPDQACGVASLPEPKCAYSTPLRPQVRIFELEEAETKRKLADLAQTAASEPDAPEDQPAPESSKPIENEEPIDDQASMWCRFTVGRWPALSLLICDFTLPRLGRVRIHGVRDRP